MSGRTFTYDGAWIDMLKALNIEGLDARALAKAAAVGDGMNSAVEEFVNRFVVTAIDDGGSVTFDTAGLYVFNGIIFGNAGAIITAVTTNEVNLNDVGTFYTGKNASGEQVEIDSVTATSGFYGMRLYSGLGTETTAGFLGIDSDQVANGQVRLASHVVTGQPVSQLNLIPGGDINLAPGGGVVDVQSDLDMNANTLDTEGGDILMGFGDVYAMGSIFYSSFGAANDDKVTFNDTTNRFGFYADDTLANGRIETGKYVAHDTGVQFTLDGSTDYGLGLSASSTTLVAGGNIGVDVRTGSIYLRYASISTVTGGEKALYITTGGQLRRAA